MGLNCSYGINANITPILQNYTVTQTGLILVISNFNSVKVNAASISIKFANSICTVSSISLPNIQCTLPKTLNNTLQLEAGSHKPLVHVENIGYLLFNPNLLDYKVSLKIISLSSNQGSSQGGLNLQIVGTGFPFCPSRIDYLNVKIGGIKAQITEFNNGAITIKTPPAQSNFNGNLEISFNGLIVSSNSYQYSDNSVPIITKINPSSASPSLKTIVSVEGSNFGTDKSKVKLFLVSTLKNTTIYELSVINCTINLIYGVLGGGQVGSYKLKIELDQVGSSKEALINTALFKYELIVISLSPQTGSIYGGTQITIKGVNFSPVKKQNQVYLGDNNYCVVLESSHDSIVCETKPAPSSYIDTPLSVAITQRVQDEAICPLQICMFIFVNQTSPRIDTKNLTFIVARAGETVTLNGSNLYPDLGENVLIKFVKGARVDNTVVFDMDLQIQPFETTATYLKFKMPALIQGSYTIQIFVENNGWAWIDPLFTIVTPIEVYGITIDNGKLDNNQNMISRGGAIINITGNGFYDELIYIDNNVWWCPILSNSTTMITCVARDMWTENKYKVYVYRDQNTKYTCNNCVFNVSGTKSPYVWTSNCTSDNLDSNTFCLLTGDSLNLSSFPIPYLEDYSSDNTLLRSRIQGKTLSVFKKNMTISFTNVPNNTYRLNIYYEPQGFASISTSSKRLNVGLFGVRSDSILSSYLGGKIFNIYGSIFPDMSKEKINNVSLCGSICKVVNYSSNFVQCLVPKLINPLILDYYQISEKEASFQTDYDVYGDNAWPTQYINDQKLTTYYESKNSFCNIVFDFRQDYLFQAQEIHYYPSTALEIATYYGLVFQGSFDGNSWDTLFTLDRNIKTGWNIWEGNSPSYRFFKIKSPIDKHASQCRISEIKFFGIKYYGKANTMDISCDATIKMNGYQLVLPSVVQYNQENTPKIIDVTPNTGPTSGGTTISIFGKAFGYSLQGVSVIVDGVICVVRIVTNEKIVCVTGAK